MHLQLRSRQALAVFGQFLGGRSAGGAGAHNVRVKGISFGEMICKHPMARIRQKLRKKDQVSALRDKA
jgi:hypothetical protein